MSLYDIYGGTVNSVTWSNIQVDQAGGLWDIDMAPSAASYSPGIAQGNITICNIKQTADQTVLPDIVGNGGATFEPSVEPVPNIQMAVSLPNTSSYTGTPQAVQTAPIFSNVVVGANKSAVTSLHSGNDFYYLASDGTGFGTQYSNSTQMPQNVVEMTVRQRSTTNAASGSIWNYNQSQIGGDMVSPQFTSATCPVSPLLQAATLMTPAVSAWPTTTAITYGQSLSSSTLTGGAASTAGTFAFSTPSIVPSAGTTTQSVIFTPTDSVDYRSITGSVCLTVSQATPTVAWTAPSPIAYGTSLSTTQLDATAVDGNGNTVAGSFAYTAGGNTFQIAEVLSAGTYAVTATFTPISTNYVSGLTASGNLTVTKVATTMIVSPSGNPVIANTSVILTAIVQSSTSGGMPTGPVSFYDGATLLGSGTLNTAGVASYSTNALAQGSHSISAVYVGDNNFTGSTASTVTLLDTAASDFTFVASGSTSQTVTSGSAASYQSEITPVSGSFSAQVIFSASGLPTGSTVTFVPAMIAAGGGASAVLVTIQTAAAAAGNNRQLTHHINSSMLSVLLLPLLTIGRRLRKRSLRRGLVLVVLTVISAGIASLTGCGNASVSRTGAASSYTIYITATSGGIQHSFEVNLGLQ